MQSLARSYTAEEWAQWNSTQQGQNMYRWWADWIPTPEGQSWCANKRREARCVVNGMIQQWGLDTLCKGEGVIDIGGDPGFVAAELLHSGIHVTVIDPAFGFAGKSDAWTTSYLQDPVHWNRVQSGAAPLRVVREPFDQSFVGNPAHRRLLEGASAMVSLYPDEGTDFILQYTAARAIRTALIPCNECLQYFPPHEPTYEGFVKQLLVNDHHYLMRFGQNAPMRRERIWGTPYCQVILCRSPPSTPQSWPWSPGTAAGGASALEAEAEAEAAAERRRRPAPQALPQAPPPAWAPAVAEPAPGVWAPRAPTWQPGEGQRRPL